MADKTTTTKTAPKLIHADNGRVYREAAGGRLVEVSSPKLHAQRMLKDISPKHMVTGLRVWNPDDPDAPGVVVTLDDKESAVVMDAVTGLLKKRAEAKEEV